MLCKNIKGRLGNQLFQYATMRAFQQQYFPNETILLSFKKVESKAKREGFKEIDSLKHFNAEYTIGDFKLNLKQKLLVFKLSSVLAFYKFIVRKKYVAYRDKVEEKYKNKLLKNNIVWKTSGYTDFDISLLDKSKNIIFYGYFESSKYFAPAAQVIRNDYQPKEKPVAKNKELYDIIKNSNSVCVSIRRGDFVENPKYRSIHYVCDRNYFDTAIDKIDSLVEKPQYVIFSDDVDWVKNNMKFPEGTVYETGNDPVWEKLRLMYNCKHFIISNSSFSWWAQFLSRNENKVVIAPKRWNNRDSNKDIYEDNWILV